MRASYCRQKRGCAARPLQCSAFLARLAQRVQILTLAVCSQASSRNKKLYRYATRRPAEVRAPDVPMLVRHLVRAARCYAKKSA